MNGLAESTTLNPEFADAVRLLRSVLGWGQNNLPAEAKSTPSPEDEFLSRAIDFASDTLPLTGSDPDCEMTFQYVPPQRVVEHLPQRFLVQEELGRGSYGIVYRAHDEHLKRDVAIKILRPEFMTDDNLRSRFLQESQAAARLNHPCIVRVFEAQQSNQATWQVSELVEGTTLSQHLNGQPMPESTATRLVRDLSDAVQRAHNFSVVHRDIKPDNILVDCQVGESLDSATPRLTDFGLARITDLATRMSHSGTLVGTPRYMAPEQLTGSVFTHGPATDIYSLGVLFYEMLAGQGPSHGIDSLVQRVATAMNHVPSIRQRFPHVSRDLATICSKCLEVLPADRYVSAAELRDDLQRFLDGRATLARPLSAMESLYRWTRRNPGVAAMTTVTLSVLLLTLALTLRSNLAFQKQNDRLGYLNEQLTAEQLRTQELNTQADESRQRAETGEQRFQKLAWNAGIRQAYSAWEHHEIPETLHLLDELKTTDTEAESRIEWQMLHQEVVNFRQPLLKLDEPIYELRQIPDSSLIVAAAGNGNIYISNAVTGELVRTIRTAAKSLHALAISPDGNFLATGGVTDADTDLSYPEVYAVSTGELICKLSGFPTTIESLEFSADGNWLACGARYETLKFINLKSLEAFEVPASRRQLWITRFQIDQHILAQNAENELWISDPTPPFHGRPVEMPFTFDNCLAVPNTSLLLCSLTHGVNLQLIDVNRTEVLCGFNGGVREVNAMAISSDLHVLSAGLANGDLVCWRFPDALDDGEYRQAVADFAVNLREVSTNSGNLRDLPDVPTFDEATRWHLFECPITSVVVGDDRIVVASQDGQVVSLPRRLPDPEFLTIRDNNDNSREFLRSVAWTPDGTQLVTIGQTGDVRVTPFECLSELNSGEEADGQSMRSVSTTRDPGDIVASSLNHHVGDGTVAVSPNGRLLATHHRGDGLSVHSLDGKSILGRWIPPDSDDPSATIDRIQFSDDSEQIAWTGTDRQLHVGPVHLNPSSTRHVDLDGYGKCLAWSPDHQKVFVGGRFDDVIEVDVSSGNHRTLMSQQSNAVENAVAIAFDADHSRLITGHVDGTLHFIDPRSGVITQRLHFHDVNIRTIILSRDGRIGICADTDANLAIWFAETGERIGKLDSISSRSIEFLEVKPAVIFTEMDTALRIFFATNDNKLTTKSWRFK